MRTVVAAVALAAATTACTDNFANINDNPTAPKNYEVSSALHSHPDTTKTYMPSLQQQIQETENTLLTFFLSYAYYFLLSLVV